MMSPARMERVIRDLDQSVKNLRDLILDHLKVYHNESEDADNQ